jgi:hypothetical protein
MKYQEYNLFLKFLWNAVDYKIFEEDLSSAIGRPLDENYVEEKWNHFKRCPAQFLQGFPELFEQLTKKMKDLNYQG